MLRSLRARLILLVGVAFLPMLAITTRDVVRERNALLEAAYEQAEQRVDRALAAQQELIADGHRYLGAVAMLTPVSQGDGATCTRTVARVRQLLEEGWSFARTRADGVVDCTSAHGTEALAPSTVRPTLARVRSDSVAVTGYGRDVATNEPVVTLTRALPAVAGAATGWLSITMHMDWVARMARDVLRDSLAVIAITDAERRIVVRYPFVGNVDGQRAPRNAAFDLMLARRNGMSEGTGIDGVRRVWIFRQLPSPDGLPVFVSVGIPEAPLVASAKQAVIRSVLTLALTVLLVLVAAVWAADRFVLRDVRALLRVTRRLAAGDLSARSGLAAPTRELGLLAESFDRMASQLEHRQDRLAHAQKMESVGQLAGGVAHDFNNLLTAIVANTEAAKEALPAGHEAHAELEQVLHASRRSGQLTRQLLAFARQQTFATRVLRLDRLLHDTSALLTRLLGEHVRLDVACDPELGATRVDPTQIEQAIINLALNARDAMPDGGALTITVRNQHFFAVDGVSDDAQPAGRWVAITVTDTGVGMPPDVVRRVFEPFFTTKAVGHGTGLGLAMVYGTARQHGGHVHVTSAVGQGTTVRLLLPVDDASEVTNETPAFGVSAAGTGQGDETILLVEDERAVRSVGARLLRARGYHVIEAEDGADALAQLTDDRLREVDLVVTDLVMPKLGGAAMIERVRARRPTMPVLLVSGYSATGVPSALLDEPGTAFLEKPFNARSLLGAVRSLLDAPRAA